MKKKASRFKLLPSQKIKILTIQGLFNFPQDAVPGKILLKSLNINSSSKFVSLWILLFINTREQETILL